MNHPKHKRVVSKLGQALDITKNPRKFEILV